MKRFAKVVLVLALLGIVAEAADARCGGRRGNRRGLFGGGRIGLFCR